MTNVLAFMSRRLHGLESMYDKKHPAAPLMHWHKKYYSCLITELSEKLSSFITERESVVSDESSKIIEDDFCYAHLSDNDSDFENDG